MILLKNQPNASSLQSPSYLQVYDETSQLKWETELDVYGKVRTFEEGKVECRIQLLLVGLILKFELLE